jgi:DNA-binding response OmpR family regulator
MSERRWLVLVVDDDPDVRDSLRLTLESHGFAVSCAASAEEGLRLYRENRPDVLIIDLMMEEVDSGTSLVRELRFMGDTPPVYLLSSVGDGLYDAVGYEDLGLSGVFQKPVEPETLVGTLTRRLG